MESGWEGGDQATWKRLASLFFQMMMISKEKDQHYTAKYGSVSSSSCLRPMKCRSQ